jgi:hypothetical protein
MTATAAATASTAAAAHAASTTSTTHTSASTAATGGAHAGESMVAVRPRRAAFANAAESAAILGGCLRRYLPIAHSFRPGLPCGSRLASRASTLHLLGRRARLQILPRCSSIALGHGCV